LDYELMIYFCAGTDKERLDWFRIINIAGEKLTDQEIRNAVYTGPWLSDAKLFKNPYLNSVYAEIYIIIVVSAVHYVGKSNTPDNFFTPMAVLSLLVLSVAVVGYLFIGEPLQLYLDGQKKEAISFFMKTVMSFAAITVIIFIIVFGVLR